MEDKVLLMLLNYNVEFNKEMNNVDNINNIKGRTHMHLFFIYSVLANYRNIDTTEVSEIKTAAIDKLYYLYSNLVKLRLEEINITFLHIFETDLVIMRILKSKLLNYLTQAADLLLEGSVDVWTVSGRREVDKIISFCIDVMSKELKLRRRK